MSAATELRGVARRVRREAQSRAMMRSEACERVPQR